MPTPASPTVHEITATRDAGRIDRYLAALDLPLSRNQVQRLIDTGHITVDGEPTRPGRKLRGGESLRIVIPPAEEPSAQAEDLPLDKLYEDQWLAVVNKPRGLVVHPAPGHPSGTLVNALLHHCHDLSGIGGVLRPGIVHRLDKDTSGLIVVAKDDATHRALQEAFKSRSVQKIYLALVIGRLRGAGTVDQPIGRHRSERKKMAVDTARGKPACSHWRSLQELDGATLVEVQIETGRTHQIRVHLASLGHPVVGDAVYGGTGRARGIGDAAARRRLLQEQQQALHAWKLGFVHPHNGTELRFTAPPPAELQQLIRDLGGTAVAE